jgi:hypothetical protein
MGKKKGRLRDTRNTKALRVRTDRVEFREDPTPVTAQLGASPERRQATIFNAASHASKAVDFLHGLQPHRSRSADLAGRQSQGVGFVRHAVFFLFQRLLIVPQSSQIADCASAAAV